MSQNSIAQTEHNNYIVFNEELFKKTSKKLLNEIKNHKEEDSLKLTTLQESLAKSLGFRNTNAILNYFNKNEELNTRKNSQYLHNWSSENIQSLFITLMNHRENDVWKDRAILLLQAVIKTLCYQRDQEEIILNADMIREHLILENIIILSKGRDFPFLIMEKIHYYLISLPGYNKDHKVQNDTVREQHGYLQVQLLSALEKIEQIEKNDPIVITPNWYQANYTCFLENSITLDKDRSSPSDFMKVLNQLDILFDMANSNENLKMKKIKTSHRLKDDTMEIFYNKFPEEDWSELFPSDTSKEYTLYKGKEEEVLFNRLSLIKPISKTPYAENSWLEDSSYKLVLNSLLRSKQFKTYHLSDLLFYSMKIVNQNKFAMFNECILNLLKNYNTVIEYSEVFNKLAK